MKLNVRTGNGELEHLGFQLHKKTVEEIDFIAKKHGIKRSAFVRHMINEFLDSFKKDSETTK